uniref:Uncharacterized protein n=1 Tax=Vannella robusta TaxID=1487602 RepID=A0A7S4MKX4_9EUKA|mmetsp:Transcript_25679/g.32742  ORF Transcript_25679/g.32742 Transcript_25679/m.32742 type:complete len:103 (+) Transcript_25679:120-428(+)
MQEEKPRDQIAALQVLLQDKEEIIEHLQQNIESKEEALQQTIQQLLQIAHIIQLNSDCLNVLAEEAPNFTITTDIAEDIVNLYMQTDEEIKNITDSTPHQTH